MSHVRKLAVLALLACGCAPLAWNPRPYATQITQANPALVTIQDPDYVWEQVVEVVDDYFKIERQERVRVVGDVMTEGYVETFPTPGATLLEPWHHDSVDFHERLESTLQTIRRRALVRVIPDSQGFLIEVAVFKELENLPRPERSTAGGATFRYDESIQRYREPTGDPVLPMGWIPQGRDVALEQVMLEKLAERLGK